MEKIIYAAVGLSVGALAGGIYLMLLRRSVENLVAHQRPGRMLLAAPLRMAVPTLALVLAAAWSPIALAGGVVGLLGMQFGAQLFVSRTGGAA